MVVDYVTNTGLRFVPEFDLYVPPSVLMVSGNNADDALQDDHPDGSSGGGGGIGEDDDDDVAVDLVTAVPVPACSRLWPTDTQSSEMKRSRSVVNVGDCSSATHGAFKCSCFLCTPPPVLHVRVPFFDPVNIFPFWGVWVVTSDNS